MSNVHFNENFGEEEAYTSAYLADGEGSFIIKDVSEGVSFAGYPKTVLKMDAFDKNGKKGLLSEHISNSIIQSKIRPILKSIGVDLKSLKGKHVDLNLLKGTSGKLIIGHYTSEKDGKIYNRAEQWLENSIMLSFDDVVSGIRGRLESNDEGNVQAQYDALGDDEIPF